MEKMYEFVDHTNRLVVTVTKYKGKYKYSLATQYRIGYSPGDGYRSTSVDYNALEKSGFLKAHPYPPKD